MGCSFMTWVRNTLCQNWLKPPSSKSHCHGCMLDFHPDSWFSNHSIDGEDEMGGIPTKSLLINIVDLNSLNSSIYLTFNFPSQLSDERTSLIRLVVCAALSFCVCCIIFDFWKTSWLKWAPSLSIILATRPAFVFLSCSDVWFDMLSTALALQRLVREWLGRFRYPDDVSLVLFLHKFLWSPTFSSYQL